MATKWSPEEDRKLLLLCLPASNKDCARTINQISQLLIGRTPKAIANHLLALRKELPPPLEPSLQGQPVENSLAAHLSAGKGAGKRAREEEGADEDADGEGDEGDADAEDEGDGGFEGDVEDGGLGVGVGKGKEKGKGKWGVKGGVKKAKMAGRKGKGGGKGKKAKIESLDGEVAQGGKRGKGRGKKVKIEEGVGVEGSTGDAGGGMDGKEGEEVVMQSIENENGG